MQSKEYCPMGAYYVRGVGYLVFWSVAIIVALNGTGCGAEKVEETSGTRLYTALTICSGQDCRATEARLGFAAIVQGSATWSQQCLLLEQVVSCLQNNDESTLLTLCDAETRERLRGKDDGIVKRICDLHRVSRGDIGEPSITAVLNVGNLCIGVVDFRSTATGKLRRLLIPLSSSREKEWSLCWTTSVFKVTGFLRSMLCERDVDGNLIVSEFSAEEPSGMRSLDSWVYGREKDGWSPVTVYFNGRKVDKTCESEPGISLLAKQEKIVESFRASGDASVFLSALLETVAPGERLGLKNYYDREPEGFFDHVAMRCDKKPYYLVESGSNILLLVADERVFRDLAKAQSAHKDMYEFVMVGKDVYRSNIDAISPLWILFARIDGAEFLK